MTSMEPTVSVVCAVRNAERTVDEALRSVLTQTDIAFELLVGDDASTDGTASRLQDLKDPRVRVITGQRPQGSAAMLNALVRLAKGEFVAVIDPADAWASADKLSSQVSTLRAHPGAAASFERAHASGPATAPSPGWTAARRPRPTGASAQPAAWLRQFLLGGEQLTHSSVLARKAAFEAVGGYDPRLSEAHDLDLWIRLSRRSGLLVGDRVLVRPRKDGLQDGFMSPRTIRTRNEEYLVYQTLFDGVDPATLREALADAMVNVDAATPEELAVEIGLLFFQAQGHAQAACWMLGLERLFDLLGDQRYRAALDRYGIDDPWLHAKMAEFSAFFPEDDPEPAPPAVPRADGLLRRWMTARAR